MKEKISKFLFGTKFGALLMINLFFIMGLFAATEYIIGGLIWFTGNVLVMLFVNNEKKETVSSPGTGGVIRPPVTGDDPNDSEEPAS